MTTDCLYFYVEGSDLDEIAPLLRRRFEEFLDGRSFVAGDVSLVDQRRPDDPTLKPGDLPDWELGLNLEMTNPPAARPAGWFEDVRAIVELLRTLSAETGRTFVVGGAFDGSRTTEDRFYIESGPVDFDAMKRHLGG